MLTVTITAILLRQIGQ